MRVFLIVIVFLSSISIYGQSQRAWQVFEIGMKASQASDHKNALGAFQKTLRVIDREGSTDVFASKVHYNLGVSYYHLRQHAEAVVEYEKAILLAGRNYERAYYALGLTHAEMRNWTAAERAFRDAIRTNSRNGEAWFDLAFVYLAQNDRDKARAAFGNAIKFDSVETAISHNNIGVLYALSGDFTGAEAQFAAAVERSAGGLDAAKQNLENCKRIAAEPKFVANSAFAFAKRSARENRSE